MRFLLKIRLYNRKERPNQSTNKGEMVKKAKGPVSE